VDGGAGLSVLLHLMPLESMSDSDFEGCVKAHCVLCGEGLHVMAVPDDGETDDHSCLHAGDILLQIGSVPVSGLTWPVCALLLRGKVASLLPSIVRRDGVDINVTIQPCVLSASLRTWLLDAEREFVDAEAELIALDHGIRAVGVALCAEYGCSQHGRTAKSNQTQFILKGLDISNPAVLIPLSGLLMDIGLTSPYITLSTSTHEGSTYVYLPPGDVLDPADLISARSWAERVLFEPVHRKHDGLILCLRDLVRWQLDVCVMRGEISGRVVSATSVLHLSLELMASGLVDGGSAGRRALTHGGMGLRDSVSSLKAETNVFSSPPAQDFHALVCYLSSPVLLRVCPVTSVYIFATPSLIMHYCVFLICHSILVP